MNSCLKLGLNCEKGYDHKWKLWSMNQWYPKLTKNECSRGKWSEFLKENILKVLWSFTNITLERGFDFLITMETYL